MDISSTEHSKPTVPYVKGWQFTAHTHIPPPPMPVFWRCCVNDDIGKMERARLGSVERCLLHPPLPGSNGSSSVKLEICDALKVGDDHNAQVVTVRVLETDPCSKVPTKGERVVAKFYDPLYFFDGDGYLNPFLCVDKHYTHEVSAYTALSDLQGSMI